MTIYVYLTFRLLLCYIKGFVKEYHHMLEVSERMTKFLKRTNCFYALG